ncbi:general stress protein [Salisediminibacterium beveridgei]|uniref:General stress protein 17M n=1 Tax=Salisediminibacterium beveridgei TaxID=632773 RepID=A0A1D7QXU4_9BACI|nr:general stress protein [Salisediminibacterium beveridgei]AOM83837.1 General stress protein 17M [Salisediminibacterium beveridgei]
MDPLCKVYENQDDVVIAVRTLQKKGLDEDNLYILYLDDDISEHASENPEAIAVGMNEQKLGTAVDRIFPGTLTGLKNKLINIGFDEASVTVFSEALQDGSTLLVLVDPPEQITF